MGIMFSQERWDKLVKNTADFWNGSLERPILPYYIANAREPNRPAPKLDVPLTQKICFDPEVPIEWLLDRIDWELSCNEYLGDSYPLVNVGFLFGVGILAAFLGVKSGYDGNDCIWFHGDGDADICDVELKLKEDNPYFQRVLMFYEAAAKRWEGRVVIGMADLGGIMDTLAAVRTNEGLCIDLYEEPEEVKRLVWEAHECWHECYQRFLSVIRPYNQCFADAFTILSHKPTYVLQSDFSYMISGEMYQEFAAPEIIATAKKLEHSMYHLDGIPQLHNLDTLLGIPEIQAVQFETGEGQPDVTHFPEVSKKIIEAGKKIILLRGTAELDTVGEQIGTCKGITNMMYGIPSENRGWLVDFMESHGVESFA